VGSRARPARTRDDRNVGEAVSVNVLGPLEVRTGATVVPLEGLKRRQVLAVLAAARAETVGLDRLYEALWGRTRPRRHGPPCRATSRTSAAPSPAPSPWSPGRPATPSPSAGPSSTATASSASAPRAATTATPRCSPRPSACGGAPRSGTWPSCPACAARRCGWRSCAWSRPRSGSPPGWTPATAALVGDLEALVADHPLRERFWRQLMLALHRNGRQAEALRRAPTGRPCSRDELGLEPRRRRGARGPDPRRRPHPGRRRDGPDTTRPASEARPRSPPPRRPVVPPGSPRR
jgi:hypothetical protein